MADKIAAKSLKVLICGGGIAGLALAYWLARSGHRVVVIEKFPALRAAGAQVDLRGQGIEAAKRMGLIDAIRSELVDEAGVSFVDSQGRPKATIMANTSGHGAQSLTSEYEIMRGNVVRILHRATKETVNYVFGKTVDRFEQDDEQALAHFSDGASDTFDLLVAADGQGSRIRKAMLPPETVPYRRMGIHMSYWFIPRTPADESNIRNTYLPGGGRMIMRRSHSPTQSQAYFVLRENSQQASDVHREPVERQKQFWANKFRNAGWQADRFIEGMMTTDFFYSQEVVQVQTDTWSMGRVVLVGDAAHCASPFSGMGVSGAFVGAYVLAGEINRNSQELHLAFANYDKVLRPFVNEIQRAVKPYLLQLGMPKTKLGVHVFLSATALACSLRIPELAARLSKDDRDGKWRLPDYTESLQTSQITPSYEASGSL